MKKTSILLLGMAMIFTSFGQQNKTMSAQSKSEVAKQKVKVESTKQVFEQLDIILSPFEDMTEFALDKNEKGILESLSKVEQATKESIFKKNLSVENLNLLTPKIGQLKELIKQKKYNEIALASTEIFEFNISNFVDAKRIENQVRIEHLDYMGFKVLALLNQDKIDWAIVKQTIFNVQKEWLALSPKVKDVNLKETFNYLFKGLILSAENNDIKTCEILANMDLTLVDVLELSI
ncbi:MAG: hypothetical protein WAO52_14615 [Prolixibacteraceae bacterium]